MVGFVLAALGAAVLGPDVTGLVEHAWYVSEVDVAATFECLAFGSGAGGAAGFARFATETPGVAGVAAAAGAAWGAAPGPGLSQHGRCAMN